MNIGRTTLAVLVAISVAILPVAGSSSMTAKSSEMHGIPAAQDMSSSDNMSPCPHHAKDCDKSKCDTDCMATCALSFFGLAGMGSVAVAFPPLFTSMVPPLASDCHRSRPGNPPFRPPRV
jgi:hypothetical protein